MHDFVKLYCVESSLKATLAVAACSFATGVFAIDYYNRSSQSLEGQLQSSISGSSSSTGWATTKGGERSIAGITEANAVYHVYTDFRCRSRSDNDCETPSTTSILVEDGATWLISGYQSTKTTTLNNVSIASGSTLHYYNCGNGGMGVLAGSFVLDGGMLQVSGRCYNSNQRPMNLSCTVTGTGAIVATRYDTDGNWENKAVPHRITGNISGFTGDIIVYDNHGCDTLSLELVSAASIPGDPAAGFTAYVVITNNATLKIDQNWVSPANRIWNFGIGAAPKIEVASGKTVTIKGELRGSAGFNKTGAGTLVIPAGTVAGGTVVKTTLGPIAKTDGTLKVSIAGDGSQLAADGVYTILESTGLLLADIANNVVDDGAFTLPSGMGVMYSIVDGTRLVMSVGNPTWFFNGSTSTRGRGNYANVGAWTVNGVAATWTESTAAEAINCVIPAGKTLWTKYTSDGSDSGDVVSDWSFTSNDGSTFTLSAKSGASIAQLYSSVQHLHLPKLVMKDGSKFLFEKAKEKVGDFQYSRSLAGVMQIDASESDPAVISAFAYHIDQARTNATAMTGSGAVKYTRDNGEVTGRIWVTGDNSAFTGSVAVKDEATNAKRKYQDFFLYVLSGANIGGNPEEFKEKGFELWGSQVVVKGDVALAQNRGFYISSNSVINVDSGRTFSSPNAIGFSDNTVLVKRGEGTLRVSGWSGTGTVNVTEGVLDITGVRAANGLFTPIEIGAIEYANAATVTLTLAGDGANLPKVCATNVLLRASSALPKDFADKVRVVIDGAYTVPGGLKTKFIVVDGTKFAIETKQNKGAMLVVL